MDVYGNEILQIEIIFIPMFCLNAKIKVNKMKKNCMKKKG